MKTVLITVDALRVDHLEQYGYHRETLSSLDRLLNNSAQKYEKVFANGPNTKESIPSILTCQYHSNPTDLEKGPTFPELLQENSITTGSIHSSILLNDQFNNINGFDEIIDLNEKNKQVIDNNLSGSRYLSKIVNYCINAADVVGVDQVKELAIQSIPYRYWHTPTPYVKADTTTDRAIEFIRKHEHEEFFLWIHYMDPHRPYGFSTDNFPYGNQMSREEIMHLMAKADRSPDQITENEKRQLINLYDSDLRFLDKHLSRLFDTLLEYPKASTNILFSSDHGEEFNEHGLMFHQNRPYDELIHVPLIIYSTKIDKYQTTLCQLIDMGPTICSLHGVRPLNEFDGQSLESPEARPIISTGSFIDEVPVCSIRNEDWKYIRSSEKELYNMNRDQEEKINIADKNEKKVNELQDLIPNDVLSSTFSTEVNQPDEDVKDSLKALGYLDE